MMHQSAPKRPLLQPVRGMHDLLATDCQNLQVLIEKARSVARLYGFQESMTPLVEYRDVFDRTVASSDIVTKEMFELVSRGEEQGVTCVLRPEGTAPLMRAVLSEGLTQNLPLKFFYAGPMFRYDRPQKGRLRQFHQVGVELIGVPDPWADLEVLACAQQFLTSLHLSEPLILELNTLGDAASYAAFRDKLVAFLMPKRGALSPDSQMRLEKNPLRIFDSKVPADQEILADAPSFHACLTPSAQHFFAQVQEGLERLGIAYTLNPRLVRGLDYYTHTAFEFKAPGLGAQSTVLAGGRYDGLSGLLGGPALPGIGWAAGIERLRLLTHSPTPMDPGCALLPQGPDDLQDALCLAQALRQQGISLEVLGSSHNLGKKMQKAQKSGYTWVLILGEMERRDKTVTLKNLTTHTQTILPQENLGQALGALMGSELKERL